MLRGKKIIVVLPAHNAAKTLATSYNRLPKELIDEIILVDDASTDDTFNVSKKLKITTYRNEVNQGYGGNLKICLAQALKHKADIIIEYHPDNQYDPKDLPTFINKASEGYDFALGSRFIHPKEALTNKMPLIKFVANRALSYLDEFILGIELSEFHSGFRMYTRKLLTNVSFMQNSDDYLFSFEIIVQAVFKKMKIAEVPIICVYHPNMHTANIKRSTIYAIGTFKTLLQYIISKFLNIQVGPFVSVKLTQCPYCMGLMNRLHIVTDSVTRKRFSIYFCNYCQLGFTHPVPKDIGTYYLKNYYAPLKSFIYNILQFRRPAIINSYTDKGRVLDVGCGDGGIAKNLHKFDYTGVETTFSNFQNRSIKLGGIENFDAKSGAYDVITFWESFEHVKNPDMVLEKCRRLLKKEGLLIIECPNFRSKERAFFSSRWFHLDPPRHITHFTPDGLKKMLNRKKFKIVEQRTLYAPEYIAVGIAQSILYTVSPTLNIVALSAQTWFHKFMGTLFLLALLPLTFTISIVLYFFKESPILLTVAKKN